MKIYTQKKTEKGFTLVETLVAITILLLVIIGPLTVAQKGIQNAYYANEQVTAVFLAQEAIEAVRELRDIRALDAYDKLLDGLPPYGETWDLYSGLDHLHPNCNIAAGCEFDAQDNEFGSCGGGECKLKINNGVYEYDSGSWSPFTRKVYVIEENPYSVSVTVEVSWTSQIFGGATTRTVKLQTWIYDHYQRYEEN